MKKLFPFFAWVFSALILLSACEQKQVEETEKSKYEYETVENDPLGVKIYTLDNGLKVYMSVNKDEPRIQTNIAVRAGSKQDPADATGLAHYLEHMLFKGNSEMATSDWETESALLRQISDLYEDHRNTDDPAEKKSIYEKIDSISHLAAQYAVPNEYDKIISKIGAKGTNAYTSYERTVYINDIPSNELEKWLMLESSRFSELVLRLFHTELETVYEEFNRGQDNDYRKVYHALDSLLYQKHPYGTQPTIGHGEHLKNPSMLKIHEYFDTYYAPNNMAVILAGDFDPDEAVDLIKKHFGDMKAKEFPEFGFEKEAPLTEPIRKEVYGPMAEWLSIAYRFDGFHSDDILYLDLISGILSNGQAGLIDLNLLQKQKVLRASAGASVRHDYTSFMLSGNPKTNQSLEDVKQLLLEQIELIKRGEFDDDLIDAVVKNEKLQQMRQNEHNRSRAYYMSDAFIMQSDWKKYVNFYDDMAKITKQQIMDFAKERFRDNYAVAYKRNGPDKSVFKVEKPKITPIDIQRDAESAFFTKLDSMRSPGLNPVFVDYKKAIRNMELNKGVPFSYIENTTNDVFTLFYILDMGTNNDRKIAMAIDYLPFLGTSKYTAEELNKEFFKLGLDYNVFSSEDRIYVYLSGLEESFEQGLNLFEHVLNNVQPDEQALQELVNDELKKREDAKKNKWSIMNQAMFNYARYGAKSPFSDVLSKEELLALDPQELTDIIRGITHHEHKIFYYGKEQPEQIAEHLNKSHQLPDELKSIPEATKYTELETNENKVYFIDYDMVQTEMLMVSKGAAFNASYLPYASLFNEYFGSGLSSIVFQEIREAKALAYSAYSSYTSPSEKEKSHYVRAYVGTQTDKLPEAVKAMMDLMNDMPEAKNQFQGAKESALKRIETERITKASIFWNYETAKKRGLDHDVRKDIYETVKTMEMDDLNDFFTQNIKGRNYTYLVIGKKSELDISALNELGEVKELTLEEVFGY